MMVLMSLMKSPPRAVLLKVVLTSFTKFMEKTCDGTLLKKGLHWRSFLIIKRIFSLHLNGCAGLFLIHSLPYFLCRRIPRHWRACACPTQMKKCESPLDTIDHTTNAWHVFYVDTTWKRSYPSVLLKKSCS